MNTILCCKIFWIYCKDIIVSDKAFDTSHSPTLHFPLIHLLLHTRFETDLAVFMIDEDVAGAVVFEVGDLQAVGVSYLLRLEGGIDCVHLDHCFGLLSLQEGQRRGGGGGAGVSNISYRSASLQAILDKSKTYYCKHVDFRLKTCHINAMFV